MKHQHRAIITIMPVNDDAWLHDVLVSMVGLKVVASMNDSIKVEGRELPKAYENQQIRSFDVVEFIEYMSNNKQKRCEECENP